MEGEESGGRGLGITTVCSNSYNVCKCGSIVACLECKAPEDKCKIGQ